MALHEHARRFDGRWLVPAGGSWALRRAANGSLQVTWQCLTCSYRSSALPHELLAELGVDIRALPIREDYAGLYARCVVRGCEAEDVELHHFAPRAIFGADAESWPQGYLCVRHHREWGERVTPQLNRRAAS